MKLTIAPATPQTLDELAGWSYPPPYDFFRAGLDLARERIAPSRIVLNVAAFNERAIAVYERGGFRRAGPHLHSFERWGDVPFVETEEAP